MKVFPVCPSVLVAVTVYVKVPAVDVLRSPGLDEPFESRQLDKPGPSTPSLHENAVETVWFNV
jgi:hypothetical protein